MKSRFIVLSHSTYDIDITRVLAVFKDENDANEFAKRVAKVPVDKEGHGRTCEVQEIQYYKKLPDCNYDDTMNKIIEDRLIEGYYI